MISLARNSAFIEGYDPPKDMNSGSLRRAVTADISG